MSFTRVTRTVGGRVGLGYGGETDDVQDDGEGVQRQIQVQQLHRGSDHTVVFVGRGQLSVSFC